MCEPVSMGIMAGVTIASTALSTAQGIQQANYQEQVARMNQKFSEDQARAEALAGNAEATTLKLKAAKFAATQKAQFAANGVDVESGSALDVLADTRLMSDEDAAVIKNNAARRAAGAAAQAANYGAQASAISSGRNWQTAGTLLGGAAKAAGYGIQGYQAWKANGGNLFPVGSSGSSSVSYGP